MSLQVNKYLTHLRLGLGFRFFSSSLKTPGCCHKCQELISKLQLCSQGEISKLWDSFWVLLPLCDGTPLPRPLIPRAVTPISCLGKKGTLGGLGKIQVWMRAQLCVVRPAFLLCWVCASNEFFLFLKRGEMLTLLPELNVACMVTVSIKIKQEKNVYICNYICGLCTSKMYIWIKIQGHVPVYFGVVGLSNAWPSNALPLALLCLFHDLCHHHQWFLAR